MAMHPAPMLAVALLLAACGGAESTTDPTPESTPAEAALDPYPFTTPTPAREATPLDGEYRREVPDELAGPPGKCRRCPPYRLELGDTNTLVIQEGAFVVRHELSGWENFGHVEVEGDRATFFNDPNCFRMRGEYRWRLDGDRLAFEVVDDPCPFGGLRRRYVTATPWFRA